MEKQKEEKIHCSQCEKEKSGWCTLYERIVYPSNFCDFGINKSNSKKES